MEETFITSIKINKVRHLEGLEIRLSDTERKHLILTGKNGSGKTSVLEALRDYLVSSILAHELIPEALRDYLVENHENIRESNSRNAVDRNTTDQLMNIIVHDGKADEEMIQKLITVMPHFQKLSETGVEAEINDNITDFFEIAFFEARRTIDKTELEQPKGPAKIELKEQYGEEKANKIFIQYLVNQRYDSLEYKIEKNEKDSIEIDKWFDAFTERLKEIFVDDSLKFVFDRTNYNFDILLSDNRKFNLNQLSDGYRAVLDIVSELLMRSAGKAIHAYDLQGIVLIDEIETHLHIDLQKKILPFLTSFFPKIQFIVTTHSPFVLSSVDNAVIYDLEKQIRVEDLSGYSVEGIIESYFDNDKYSKSIQDKIVEFEALMTKPFLTEKEKLRIDFLEQYFDELPDFLSPELQVKIQQIQLAKLV